MATIILTKEECENHFHTALCNGVSSGHMAGYGLRLNYEDAAYNKAKEKLDKPCIEDVWLQILKDGGQIWFEDNEEGHGEKPSKITLADVHERLPKTPISHLTDMIEESDDAITADVVLQTVFFGEVMYG